MRTMRTKQVFFDRALTIKVSAELLKIVDDIARENFLSPSVWARMRLLEALEAKGRAPRQMPPSIFKTAGDYRAARPQK